MNKYLYKYLSCVFCLRCMLVFTGLVLLNTAAFSQTDKRFLDNKILYTKYTVADKIKEDSKWWWEFDVVYRRQSELGNANIFQRPLRFSVRPWIAYQVTKLTRISFQPLGYFNSAPRFPLETDMDSDFERELRTTIQINNNVYFGRVNFTHRIRIESRWRGIDEPEGATQNFRVRYRLRTRIPLNTDYFYVNRTFYISQYSEMHVEFGKNYGTNYLSQNRNYLGIGYRFWDWARVELGWIHQYNFRGNNRDIDVSNGPMFYLFLDWLGKLNTR